jgi:Smg protein
MIDILVYLFANYHDFSARPKTRTLRRRLSAVGFNDEAIGVALRWLDGLKGAPLLDWPDGHRAMRIYVPEEQRKLGADCLGFIAFLEASGLLSPGMRELVVERAMMLDDDPSPHWQVQDHRPDGSVEPRTGPRAPDCRGASRRGDAHPLH